MSKHFSDLSNKNASSITFNINDIDVSVVNALRRVILSNIENVAFKFEEKYDKDITITDNTSALHNEIMKQRLSLLPINLTDDEILGFNKYNYKFVIDVVNKTNDLLDITTKDIQIFDKNNNTYPKAFVERVFPANPFTKDHILLTKLKPNLFNNEKGGKFKMEGYANKYTASTHAGYSMVSKAVYENVVDEELAEKEFEKKYNNLNETEKAKQRKSFETLDKFRYFKMNEFKEPTQFKFKIDSECAITSVSIFFKGLLVLIRKIIAIKDAIANNNEDKVQIVHEVKNIYKLVIHKENDTIGNLIKCYIYNRYIRANNREKIDFAGYFKPHPLENLVIVKIGITDKINPDNLDEFLVGVLEDMKQQLISYTDEWIAYAKVDKSKELELYQSSIYLMSDMMKEIGNEAFTDVNNNSVKSSGDKVTPNNNNDDKNKTKNETKNETKNKIIEDDDKIAKNSDAEESEEEADEQSNNDIEDNIEEPSDEEEELTGGGNNEYIHIVEKELIRAKYYYKYFKEFTQLYTDKDGLGFRHHENEEKHIEKVRLILNSYFLVLITWLNIKNKSIDPLFITDKSDELYKQVYSDLETYSKNKKIKKELNEEEMKDYANKICNFIYEKHETYSKAIQKELKVLDKTVSFDNDVAIERDIDENGTIRMKYKSKLDTLKGIYDNTMVINDGAINIDYYGYVNYSRPEYIDDNKNRAYLFASYFRYKYFYIGNQSLAYDYEKNDTLEIIANKYSKNEVTECFSTPFNRYYNYFCSAFPDLDEHFGSLGNFFHRMLEASKDKFTFPTKVLKINPIFVLTSMNYALELSLTTFKKQKNDYIMTFILPNWTDFEGVDKVDAFMEKNKKKYKYTRTVFPKGQVRFRNYFMGKHIFPVPILFLGWEKIKKESTTSS